jgi:hypothetical protein
MRKETNCLCVMISILVLSVPINKDKYCLNYVHRVGAYESLQSENL